MNYFESLLFFLSITAILAMVNAAFLENSLTAKDSRDSPVQMIERKDEELDIDEEAEDGAKSPTATATEKEVFGGFLAHALLGILKGETVKGGDEGSLGNKLIGVYNKIFRKATPSTPTTIKSTTLNPPTESAGTLGTAES